MIEISDIKCGDDLWVVKKNINTIIFPETVVFECTEPNTNKLVFVSDDTKKKVCYAISDLFETKLEAEIYAVVEFFKLLRDIPLEDVEYEVDATIIEIAKKMMSEFEEQYPEKVLYYFMND